MADTKSQEKAINEHDTNDEVLFRENPNRFVVFPIEYPEIWEYYKKMQALNWTAEEIDLHDDLADWPKLSKDEQHFIKMILAFFAASDGIVNENLAQQFMHEVQISEARMVYGFQIMMENVHGETYSLMIDSLIKDKAEQMRLFRAIETIPSIKKLSQWALKWINSDNSYAERLVAFACVEGILFSGPFCALYWLKTEKKMMPGLTFSNELISRDEGLHMDFACLLYSMLTHKLTEERIHAIVMEAVEFEEEFITESLPCRLIGMNADMMKEYIRFVADRLCLKLGVNEIWNAKNPFSFMENIGLDAKTNFFEKRVAEYSRSGFEEEHQVENRGIELLDDF